MAAAVVTLLAATPSSLKYAVDLDVNSTAQILRPTLVADAKAGGPLKQFLNSVDWSAFDGASDADASLLVRSTSPTVSASADYNNGDGTFETNGITIGASAANPSGITRIRAIVELRFWNTAIR